MIHVLGGGGGDGLDPSGPCCKTLSGEFVLLNYRRERDLHSYEATEL